MPTYTPQEIEQNTRFMGVWLAGDNHPEVYEEAHRLAEEGDVEAFKEYVIEVLRAGVEPSGAFYTSREMSDGDLEHGTDWVELMTYVEG